MIFEVNNVQYEGFQSISVTSSVRMISDSFSITCNNRWRDGGLKAGDESRIIDGEGNPLIDGFVDILNPVIGGTMSIAGRDKAGDLIDSMPSGTGEFVGLTMKEIIQSLCQPFGIIVTGEDGRTINRFRYSLNQPVATAIKTLVARQGYLCNSDGSGDLVIQKAGITRAPFVLQEGVNIIDGSAVIDSTKLHSSYKVLGQNYDNNVINASFEGLANRYRPYVANDTGNLQIRDAQTSSEWLARVSDGSAQTYTITVADIQTVRPNTIIECSSQTLGIQDDLLITDIKWVTDSNGSRTILTLANPYIFGLDAVNNTYL
jgi:prophage tail gpP-like protein